MRSVDSVGRVPEPDAPALDQPQADSPPTPVGDAIVSAIPVAPDFVTLRQTAIRGGNLGTRTHVPQVPVIPPTVRPATTSNPNFVREAAAANGSMTAQQIAFNLRQTSPNAAPVGSWQMRNAMLKHVDGT